MRELFQDLLFHSLYNVNILFQLAQHNGYIKVDWTKVKRALTKASAEAEKDFKKNKQSYFANVSDKNVCTVCPFFNRTCLKANSSKCFHQKFLIS